MSYFNRVPALCCLLALLLPCLALAQSPPVPDKSPGIPSKTVPYASPQVQASPQASFAPAPQYDQPAVVLQAAPRVYAVNRVVLAAPVAYAPAVCAVGIQVDPIAYAGSGCGVAQQQVVVQRNVIQHQAIVSHGIQQAQVNHAVVGAGVGRQPKKIKTKQVTRVKRGLFGR